MVANPDKFQVIFLGSGIPVDIKIKLDLFEICNSREVKLLGVTIDNKLRFFPIYRMYVKRYWRKPKL